MQFYAQPYNPDAQGFYFESYAEFEDKSKALTDSFGLPVEEFEIEVIDATCEKLQLAEAAGVNQGNIKAFIEFIETSDEQEWPTLFYLMDSRGINLEDAQRDAKDYHIEKCNLLEAASREIDETIHGLPDFVARYFDYNYYAKDREREGDLFEFNFGWKTYTCTNANY